MVRKRKLLAPTKEGTKSKKEIREAVIKTRFKKELRNLVCNYDSYTINYNKFEKELMKLISKLLIQVNGGNKYE